MTHIIPLLKWRRSHGLEGKLTILKYIRTITQLLGELGMPDLLFICVTNYFACVELWANEDIEISV